MTEQPELQGEVALVTGGAAGLGLAIATTLAERGARVAIADIDEEGAARSAAALPGNPGTHRAYRTDVASADDVNATIGAVVSDLGGLSILVNNAGIARIGPHTEAVSDEDWRATTSIMQDGVFYAMRAAGRVMLERGRGSVINIASIRGFSPNPGRLAYCAAKAAVVMMTRVAAAEWGPRGVRVNVVAPGVMRTAMWDQSVADGHLDEDFYESTIPARRIGDPRDVAELVAYLASDRASYITGTMLTVDGGLTAVPAG
jgi:NAD(P)-dependent dehydrogenase (short-subunit alcohol dehydrogenase family)